MRKQGAVALTDGAALQCAPLTSSDARLLATPCAPTELAETARELV